MDWIEAVAKVYAWMAQESFFGNELVLIGLEFNGAMVRGVYVYKDGDGIHHLTPEFWI